MQRGSPSILKGFVTLLIVLAVPFLLRPRDHLLDTSGESIVVITPHSEPLRYEFARGFREHMRKRGRTAWIDWRTPGSSREISRFITSEFDTSFAHLWKNSLHRPWSARIAAGYADPNVAQADTRPDGEEVRLARRTFLESGVGIGIDLLFGTGANEAAMHARAGRLVDAGLRAKRPDLFGDHGIPEIAGGKVMWDAEGRWSGACLTVFGICYNRDSVARLGLERAACAMERFGRPSLFRPARRSPIRAKAAPRPPPSKWSFTSR